MESRSFKIYDAEGAGSAYVSEDAVAVIAGMAASEVEGVDSITGGITGDSIFRLGRKKILSNVHLSYEEGKISIALSLVIKVGYSIPEVSKEVQSKVKSEIENMTGIFVSKVDIQVTSVIVQK